MVRSQAWCPHSSNCAASLHPGCTDRAPAGVGIGTSRPPDLGALLSVKRLKFMQALRPDDTLALTLKRAGDKVTFVLHKGELECTRGTLVFAAST